MLLTYQHNSLLIFSLAATCCLFSGTRASLPDARNKNNTTSVIRAAVAASPAAPPPYECNSMDIRNHCTEFTHLENCTVITGYLIIVLLQPNDTCDYSQYRFPKLREITDFLLIYDVKNLTSIKHMFPNLTVIRGLKLFLNYALGITRMHELQTVEFPSLVAIQRGHVLIGSNPKLCFLNMTNFDRLTLTIGENHIFPSWEAVCSPTAKCLGCDTGYCWSNMVCQKFENDNIINYQQGIQHCNAQCLGGCYNRTAQGCAVCRSWSDHGTCVEECPEDKYASEHFLRCYTREECIDKKLMIYKQTCVAKCPSGYKLNNATHECDSCGGVNNCTRICNPPKVEDPFWVYSLRDVEDLKGCDICNASVVINLRNRINEQELFKNLGDIKEIVGHLKVYQSPYLTTLTFFKKLEKIHGTPLENQHYSLIVYNNRKLRYLWPVKSGGLQLINGGMYLHANGRLCNRVIRVFKNAVKHDSSLDSLQTSDQEVLCSPAKLHLNVEVLSHRALKFSWPKDETSEEVEIIYKPIATDKSFVEQSELDTNVCERINWQRELKFAIELPQNTTHYTYTVDNLEPHTKYACLVKTFGKDDSQEARSEMTFVTTQIVIPPPPIMKISKKSFDSLTVHMYYENREDEMVDFYMLEVYEIGERKDIVDQRDYCADAMKPHADYRNEDYEECCSRRLEEAEDDVFKKQLQKEFGCSSDNKEYCGINSLEDNINPNALLSKRLEHSETNYTIRSLERFQLYAIQVKACNHAGCGSFSILNERTNYSLAADKIYDLTACKMPHNNEYRVHFKEPEKPNGIITAYTLHFRNFEASSTGEYDNHLHCITRREHERNRFMYVGYLKSTYNQAAVKVESFGHHTFTDWVAITPCTGVPSLTKTKLAGPSSHGWNVFFIFFSIGAGGTVLWVCYKRKYWRKLPVLCRYIPPLHLNWRALRHESSTEEDRQILVDDFETVRFHNSAEEDMKYLVH